MALLSFDDRDGTIWMNGEMVPWREAKTHVICHGLHYANCVFEGERAYNGKIFKSKEHAERLLASAEILGMPFPYSVEEIMAAKDAVMEENGVVDGYLRPVAWRGSEQMGISAKQTTTHVAIACWEWPSYFDPEKREKGITLKTSPWRKPAPDTAPSKSKAAGLYMIGTLSKHTVEDAGYDDALMLDYRGQVAEATGANIFFVKGGELYTPVPDCFLDGITRRTVIALAKDAGITVKETKIFPEDLPTFEECFLTGTAAEVTAVGKIDDLSFTVGPLTKQLRGTYEKLVRGE